MKIQEWTIRNREGEIVANNVADIIEWQKAHNEAMVVARLESIKEMVIY